MRMKVFGFGALLFLAVVIAAFIALVIVLVKLALFLLPLLALVLVLYFLLRFFRKRGKPKGFVDVKFRTR